VCMHTFTINQKGGHTSAAKRQPGSCKLSLCAGGKWLCVLHKNVSKAPSVISIGSNGDSSFEADVHKRLHAFSHTFDFTLNATNKARISSHPYLKFYDMGLAGRVRSQETFAHFQRWFPRMKVVTVPQMLRCHGAQVRRLLQNRL